MTTNARHVRLTTPEHGTPGPWEVRERWGNGMLVDCFVQAPDVNGYAYAAEILGDDEYREQSGGVQRKLADCQTIVAAVNAWDSPEALRARIAALEGK